MKIADRKAEPPGRARGQIARTLHAGYLRAALSHEPPARATYAGMGQVVPVDKWGCTRAKRIEALQRNENRFVKEPCVAGGLW